MDENNSQNNIGPDGAPVIHTYAGDMASMVRDHEASVIKIAMAEQRRREQESAKQQHVRNRKRSTFFAIGAVVLVLITIVGVKLLKAKIAIDSVHPEVLTRIPTFIPTDTDSVIDADRFTGKEDLTIVFNQERGQIGNTNQVRSIFFTRGIGANKAVMKTSEFMKLLQSSIPGTMARTLDESMMMGIYTDSNSKTHPYFIFKNNNFDTAYAGSLAWENTLLDEFFPLFGIDVSGDNKVLLANRFTDKLVENLDTRILSDNSGNILMYSLFLNKDYYMITDSESVIKEMLKRLRSINTKAR
jgi:hypothetical protein